MDDAINSSRLTLNLQEQLTQRSHIDGRCAGCGVAGLTKPRGNFCTNARGMADCIRDNQPGFTRRLLKS